MGGSGAELQRDVAQSVVGEPPATATAGRRADHARFDLLRRWWPGGDPDTDVRRYEAYTRWAYGIGIVIVSAWAVGPALAGPRWFAVLALVWLAVFDLAAIRLADREFCERTPSRRVRWLVAALGIGLVTLFVVGADPTRSGDAPGKLNGVEGDLGAGVLATTAALMLGMGVSWSMRSLAGLLAVAMLIVGAGHAMQDVRPVKALLISLLVLLVGASVLPLGYLSRRTLEVVRRLDRTRGTYADLAVTSEQARFQQDVTQRYEHDLHRIAADCAAARGSGSGGGAAALLDSVAARAHDCDQAVRATVARYRHPPTDPPSMDASAAMRPAPSARPPGRGIAHRRAAVERARSRSGNDVPRFERYVVWSVLLVFIGPALTWADDVVRAQGSVRAGLLAAGLAFFPAAVAIVLRDFLSPAMPDALRVVVAAAAVALTLLELRLATPAELAAQAGLLLSAPGVVPLAMVALGIRWSVRRCGAFLLVGTGLVAWQLAALGLRPVPLTLTVLIALGSSVLAMLIPAASWWMLEVAWTLHRAREARADLAVARERLRFARDLHDGYGRALAAVAMTSRLGAELSRRGDDAGAARQIGTVEHLTREALDAAAGLVSGRSEVDLPAEVAAAEAMLRAAGARVDLVGFADALPRLDDGSSQALAWVVREGATNIWRHSRPRAVTLALRVDDGSPGQDRPIATLRLRNDGTAGDGSAAPDRVGGSGLAGLRERLDPLGGTLHAGRRGEEFVLEVTVPVPPRRGGRRTWWGTRREVTPVG